MHDTIDQDPSAEGAVEEGVLQQIVLLGVGGHLFGVPVDTIREIIPPRPFTPLPGAGSHVCGLINLRGRLVTVIDLGARLKLTPASAHPEHSIVVLDHEGGLVGMVVEEVAEIIRVDPAGLDDSSEALRSLRIDRAYVRGIGEVGDRIFIAIDPEEILRPILV